MGEEKKNLDQLNFPDIKYHEEHTWANVVGEEMLIGISDFAQDQLGEIVFVELPGVGDSFDRGEIFGQAESVKSVSALYIPISCEVSAVNEKLADSPGIINTDPYGDGWMIVVKPRDLSELKSLLSKEEYKDYLGEGNG